MKLVDLCSVRRNEMALLAMTEGLRPQGGENVEIGAEGWSATERPPSDERPPEILSCAGGKQQRWP